MTLQKTKNKNKQTNKQKRKKKRKLRSWNTELDVKRESFFSNMDYSECLI